MAFYAKSAQWNFGRIACYAKRAFATITLQYGIDAITVIFDSNNVLFVLLFYTSPIMGSHLSVNSLHAIYGFVQLRYNGRIRIYPTSYNACSSTVTRKLDAFKHQLLAPNNSYGGH